jgi:hypothetical protein
MQNPTFSFQVGSETLFGMGTGRLPNGSYRLGKIQKLMHFCKNHLKARFRVLMLEVRCVLDKNDDNHANQCNPNNDAYWQSRGEDERPDDWEERSEKEE